MNNYPEIPDNLYEELVNVFGQEKADEILSRNRNFTSLNYLILNQKLKSRLGISIPLLVFLIYVFAFVLYSLK